MEITRHEASIGQNWPLFNHAPTDSLSSRALKRSHGSTLSVYWTDRALDEIHRVDTGNALRHFDSGNVTYLSEERDAGIAGYEFDSEEAGTKSIPIERFIDLSGQWRALVMGFSAKSRYVDHTRLELVTSCV